MRGWPKQLFILLYTPAARQSRGDSRGHFHRVTSPSAGCLEGLTSIEVTARAPSNQTPVLNERGRMLPGRACTHCSYTLSYLDSLLGTPWDTSLQELFRFCLHGLAVFVKSTSVPSDACSPVCPQCQIADPELYHECYSTIMCSCGLDVRMLYPELLLPVSLQMGLRCCRCVLGSRLLH